MRTPPRRISALFSDVDGTLVNAAKALSPAAINAVMALYDQGTLFSVVSSRPPRGLRMVVETLKISAPIWGFNGGLLTTPQGVPIESYPLSPEHAREATAILTDLGVDAWVFTERDWLVMNLDNPYIAREAHTVQFEPTLVTASDLNFNAVYKVVGANGDVELLAKATAAIAGKFGKGVAASCSQVYYLDITHQSANKGNAVASLAQRLSLDLAEIAVIGDAMNDVRMFERAGFSIAMGNGSAAVQRAATVVTDTNDNDGFAKAVTRFLVEGSTQTKAGALP